MDTCCWPDCPGRGAHGIGWGLSTGLVQFYCPRHYVLALVRLAELIGAVRELAAR